MAKNVALILAAGSGTRMQESTADKILAPIAGEPVVCYSVRAFISSGVCNQITIVYKDAQQRKNLEAAIAAIDFSLPLPIAIGRGSYRGCLIKMLSLVYSVVNYYYECASQIKNIIINV